MTKKILIIAGEISGDIYAADLAVRIQQSIDDVTIIGVGGQKMKDAGIDLLQESYNWGTIGFIEAFKKIPEMACIYWKIRKYIMDENPDLIIAVDYPGFNMRIVELAKKYQIPTLYYFPPAKWSTDPEDVVSAARSITYVAATFDFSKKLYEKAGARVNFVGHPLLDIVKASDTVENIKKSRGIPDNEKVISLLPGSREREIVELLPIMLESAELFQKNMENVRFIVPLVSSTLEYLKLEKNKEVYEKLQFAGKSLNLDVWEDKTYDAMVISDFSIVASGTATLEAAILRVPMVIVYKVSRITEIIARNFRKLPEYFGLPNLICDKYFVPELIQEEVSPEKIVMHSLYYLSSEERIQEMKKNFDNVISKLGDKGASQRVVDMVRELLKDKN